MEFMQPNSFFSPSLNISWILLNLMAAIVIPIMSIKSTPTLNGWGIFSAHFFVIVCISREILNTAPSVRLWSP